MPMSRIVMRLARNPGTEFANGDDGRGYVVTAPLSADGSLDAAAYSKSKAQCVVRRFVTGEAAVEGLLARRGTNWFFDYDSSRSDDNEPVHRLGAHHFTVGEYVSVTDEDSRPLTYKVVEVLPLEPVPFRRLRLKSKTGL